MKFLKNLAIVFVDQLEARLEHEITEALAPPPKQRKTRRVPKGPMREQRRIVQVSPGVEYIPPEKPRK